MSVRRLLTSGLVVTVLALSSLTAAGGERIEDLVEAVYAASPSGTPGGRFSHFPVPFVYAPWEAEVKAGFGRMSLAQANEHLYRDLPPIKAEDEAVPVNEVLAKALAADPERMAKILVAALRGDPKRPQWSVVAACARAKGDEVIDPLIRIAEKDPDATDRAFAVRELARRRHARSRDALRLALLDDHASVRLLALDGLGALGDPFGDVALLTPVSPRNPFHLLFLQKALVRVLPEENLQRFLALPWRERLRRVEAARGSDLDAFRKWIVGHRDRPFGAMMTTLLGDEKATGEALETLVAVLLRQGGQPDPLLGVGFWTRSAIIETWRQSDGRQAGRLAELLAEHVEKFRPETTMLLVALGYAFEALPEPRVVPHLAKVRSLKTDNPDVYLAAAAGLAGQRSPEAVPSLVHVLSLGQEPFATVALRHLERLTGVETPGKPKDVGPLGKLGLPQEPLDVAKAHAFWRGWHEERRGRLKLDPDTGRLVAAAAGPEDLVRDLARWGAATPEQRRAAAKAVDERLEAFELARLEIFEAGGQKHEVAIFRHVASGLELSLIPGGRYTIGSPPEEPARYPEEVRHDVSLSPFLISRTEVTQRAWKKLMGSDPAETKGPDRPVESVSWEDARAFGATDGLALPTEAQWEVACRAGTSTAYLFGSDPAGLAAFAWFKASSKNETHPVGKKKPNAFGLHDVLGNVIEWCADGYAHYPRGAVPRDPIVPPTSRGSHVVRGGCFTDEPPGCRSAFRFGMKRDARYGILGFRVAFTLMR